MVFARTLIRTNGSCLRSSVCVCVCVCGLFDDCKTSGGWNGKEYKANSSKQANEATLFYGLLVPAYMNVIIIVEQRRSRRVVDEGDDRSFLCTVCIRGVWCGVVYA